MQYGLGLIDREPAPEVCRTSIIMLAALTGAADSSLQASVVNPSRPYRIIL